MSTKTNRVILIETDGYNITHNFFKSFEEAHKAMSDRYYGLVPEEFDEDWAEMSYCGKRNAILYNNGCDVYVWAICDIPPEDADV